jgi:dTDP-4-amino-4,6-dideoxygalactose transaminase
VALTFHASACQLATVQQEQQSRDFLAMYSYRVSRGMPYWNGAIYRAILRTLASGSVVDGCSITELRRLIVEMFDVEDVILCGSGTLALELALRASGVRQDDEVILPAFCCSAVVRPIVAVGALAVLADNGPELNLTVENLDAALTKKTRAVIVPHLFGNPADIVAIRQLARSKNISVIDDAAQALGATIGGRPVGTLGDFGILSFGVEKVGFGFGGGVVLSNSREPPGNAASAASPLLAQTLVDVLSILLWWRCRPYTLPLRKQLSSNAQRSPVRRPDPYRSEGMANLKASVALLLLKSLEANLAARRARVRAYCELLGNHENLELVPHRQGSACLAQVIRVQTKKVGEDLSAAVIDALGKAGYEVQGSYVPIHRLPHFDRCVWDPLPHTDRVWPDLVELPCEPNVSMAHVEQIAAIVKRVIARR